MNPRTLRALLPVLREARDAGVRKFAVGQGDERMEFELAPPDAAPGMPMEPGTDPTGQDDGPESDPRKIMEEHYRLHGRANAVLPGTGSGS